MKKCKIKMENAHLLRIVICLAMDANFTAQQNLSCCSLAIMPGLLPEPP